MKRRTLTGIVLVMLAWPAAAAPQSAVAAVTAHAEVETRGCCYGYESTDRDFVTVSGSPGSDTVSIVSVEGGYEILDPAGVTPSGDCAALSPTAARCERRVDPASQPLREPPALRISGGPGDDELSAAAVASDTPVLLDGGPGADLGRGGAGPDTVVDADGDADSYDGGAGIDDLYHDSASPFIASLATGRAAEDAVASIELLLGNVADDRLTGSPGRDLLLGGAGHDLLAGGGGDDELVGGAGDDVLRGGPGDDVLRHRRGRDRADCGAGRGDLLVVAGRSPVEVKRCERSDALGGYRDFKYDDPAVAGTVHLGSIRRAGDVLKVRAVCAEGGGCPVRLSLSTGEGSLSSRLARSGTIRLRLDRRGRRVVGARRLLTMTVQFHHGTQNYGGVATYVLDPP